MHFTINKIAKYHGVSRQRVHQWIKANRLPKPDYYVGQSPVWEKVPEKPCDPRYEK